MPNSAACSASERRGFAGTGIVAVAIDFQFAVMFKTTYSGYQYCDPS